MGHEIQNKTMDMSDQMYSSQKNIGKVCLLREAVKDSSGSGLFFSPCVNNSCKFEI